MTRLIQRIFYFQVTAFLLPVWLLLLFSFVYILSVFGCMFGYVLASWNLQFLIDLPGLVALFLSIGLLSYWLGLAIKDFLPRGINDIGFRELALNFVVFSVLVGLIYGIVPGLIQS